MFNVIRINLITTIKTIKGEIIMKYESKRHPGTVAKLISEDSDGVKLKFEDGTEKIVSRATFRRWWKKLEEPEMESNVNVTPEVETSTEQKPKKSSTKKINLPNPLIVSNLKIF